MPKNLIGLARDSNLTSFKLFARKPFQSIKFKTNTKMTTETTSAPSLTTTIKSNTSGLFSNVLARFAMTFAILHTINWLSVVFYSNWCIDASFLGFFKNMINGHGPVCHALMMVAYNSQSNIYTLLGTAGIAAGVTWISDKIFASGEQRDV